MRRQDVEVKVAELVRRVEAGERVEDGWIELKREWPDPGKAAVRLAAHCNAARSERVLWVIGLDEEVGVTGAEEGERANWIAQVASRFDERAPRLLVDAALAFDGRTVVGLLFEAVDVPFVVKHRGDLGAEGLEVPWREGTRTRSARRRDLLGLLVPRQSLPEIELLPGGNVIAEFQPRSGTAVPPADWKLTANVYVVPRLERRLIVPFHRGSCVIETPQSGVTIERDFVALKAADGKSPLARSTSHEAILDGPGRFELSTSARGPCAPGIRRTDIEIVVRLSFADVEERLTLAWKAVPEGENDQRCVWTLGPTAN